MFKRVLSFAIIFTFVSLSLLSCASSSDAGSWKGQNLSTPINYLGGIWGSSSSDIFAVGYKSTILRLIK
jgi:hypothetical protein